MKIPYPVLGLALLAVAPAASAVCPAAPPGCPVGTVCGQNLCPSDIDAVKCAIASTPDGGTVVLQGTFRFSCMAGVNDSPRLTKRLNLQGNCETTILGDGLSDAGSNQETALRINAGADLSTVSGITFKQLDYGIDVVGSASGAKVSDVTIDGNRFEDLSLQAVSLIHCRNARFTGNYLRIAPTGAQPYGPVGIQNLGSFDTLIEGNVFDGPGSGVSQYAVTGYIDFASGDIETLTQRLIFRGNDVSKVDYGVITVGEHQEVKSNRFFNLGTGVGTTSAVDLTVEDNCFESFGGSAVELGGIPISGNGNPPSTQTASIRNNAIASSGQNGVQIRVPSSDVSNDQPFGHLRNLVFYDPSYRLSEVRVGGQVVNIKKSPYKSYVQVGKPARVTVRSDGYPWWTGALPKDISVKTNRPGSNTSVLHLVAGSATRPTCSAQGAPCPAFALEAEAEEGEAGIGGASLAGPVAEMAVPPLPAAE
jgi:hypothetical protein